MSVIDEVRNERLELARVLKKHAGIRRMVEELYPDSAHFIYELLQNAEDTGATKVRFELAADKLMFEHNGRAFAKQDVFAITDIGEGTKSEDEDKIGRFGIGFKAVFAYSETPRIWSPTFSFEISDLVLPAVIPGNAAVGDSTRFEFPFNNPKKSPTDAFEEIRQGLDEIAQTTLLFLSHISEICWQIQGRDERSVRRVAHTGAHLEIYKTVNGAAIDRSHYLLFKQPVQGLESQSVAMAFELDRIPGCSVFDEAKDLREQFRVAPARPGQVAVFFSAAKESSGLRFHVHAPFVPELSRASIKETPANGPLFRQLAELAASSLWGLKDLGFLDVELFAVLPNPDDEIPARYQPIREAIVSAMNEQPLTPTHDGRHEPASRLISAKAALKSLLGASDLAVLLDTDDQAPIWAKGAPQKNSNADKFLSSLAIEPWDVEDFADRLQVGTDAGGYGWRNGRFTSGEPEEEILNWLGGKSEDWHQSLYALLHRELADGGDLRQFRSCAIVRVASDDYRTAKECFFADDEVSENDEFPRVARGTYTSGRSASDKDHARRFLEAIGVREVGEIEMVEAILKSRYSREAKDPARSVHLKDLRRFFTLVDSNPRLAGMFQSYFVLQGEDAQWYTPDEIYLDQPFQDTGLSEYYRPMGDDAERVALNADYAKERLNIEKLAGFAGSIGAETGLSIQEVNCFNNPQWSYLQTAPGERWSDYGRNSDFTIAGLSKLLDSPTVGLSRLLWRTMARTQVKCLSAVYRKNGSSPPRYADSQLVHVLRRAKWVPQASGVFVVPRKAVAEELPDGFAYDAGWEWLKKIRFGEETARKQEENRQKRQAAQELGFENDSALDDARWYAGLDTRERERIRQEHEARQVSELPERESANPELRSSRVADQAAGDPERRTEKRTRSVSVGREAVKGETEPYLREQYTNSDGEMICQICKYKLPFMLADGRYYVEKVEFLRSLHKRHYQNYLALCPNHAAMFQHANDADDILRELFCQTPDGDLDIVLAGKNVSIYFTRVHRDDLRALVENDRANEDQ